MKRLLWLLALLPFVCLGVAAQQPSAPDAQAFSVLRTGHLVGPSQQLTRAEANCTITGSGEAAAMKCSPIGVTSKNAYTYYTALIVDSQGTAYVIACRVGLLSNLWCRSFGSTRVLRGSLTNSGLAIADGDEVHNYFLLASKNVGPLTLIASQLPPPAPAAPASPPRSQSATVPAPNGNDTAASPTVLPAPAAGSLQACVSAAAACVNFQSEPSGADIYVDGKFVGDTPSTLTLAPGSHQIRIEAQNKTKLKPWARTFDAVAGSQITLRAVLEK